MTIALSHGGPTIYNSSSRSDDVLVGTARGVVRISRRGSGWEATETTLEGKHIGALLIEPTSGKIFAGSYKDGSVDVSEDGGHTWRASDTGLTERDVYSLEAKRIGGRLRLFCGTEPAKLFVSDDMGATWSERAGLRQVPTVEKWYFPGPPHIAHAKHVSFDPRDEKTVYVSIEVGGLLRSRDGGDTWEDIPGMFEDVHRLIINPKDPRKMYVSGGAGLWLSDDGGETWENTTDHDHEIGGYPDQLVYHPGNPELMFVAAASDTPNTWRETHNAGAHIARSRDAGRTWEILTNGLPDAMQGNVEAMCLEAVGDGCSVFAATTSGEVFVSDDAGDSWSLAVGSLAPISKGGHFVPLAVGAGSI
jgi:photosystem II stability/assembly factor-like uncharacterized protein